MKRAFYIGGQKEYLNESEEFVAIINGIKNNEERLHKEIGKLKYDHILAKTGKGEKWQKAISAYEKHGISIVKSKKTVIEDIKSLKKNKAANIEGIQPILEDEAGNIYIKTDQLSIQFRNGQSKSDIESILEKWQLEIIYQFTFDFSLYQVKILPGKDAFTLSRELTESGDVLFAEPELLQNISYRVVPIDEHYVDQWQHHQATVGLNGVPKKNSDVNSELAWNHTFGQDIKIAVVDLGIDVTHPDLASNIFSTADAGAAYFNPTFNLGLTGFPDHDHGTFCAGMAAAAHNRNAVTSYDGGVVGSAYSASLIPISVPGISQVTLGNAPLVESHQW